MIEVLRDHLKSLKDYVNLSVSSVNTVNGKNTKSPRSETKRKLLQLKREERNLNSSTIAVERSNFYRKKSKMKAFFLEGLFFYLETNISN